ncbi:FUSC family protein [Bordetella sp. 02P26C-1]|uniref:FUSC family protein n=1 Tax=Bordetella sp. 02P26C-1 TaxID=2683195 RepID=UPI001354B1D9|nr:FUSC family protein [Bordetella sp. 02P26C-1]MVW78805.1 hypothetical protein [Bordetella sp. 02P26C-1]
MDKPDTQKDEVSLSPSSWLREVARLNPASWNISRCSRAALAVCLPMAVGHYTDTLMYTLWISLGSLFPAIGERDAPYSATFRKILTAAPIGAAGFMAGYLQTMGLPWTGIVLIMSVIGFLLSIASSYSAAISIGSLQFMIMAAVALGNPEIQHFWMSSLLVISGALFAMFLLLLEKWFRPHHPRRDAIVQVLQALSAICKQKLAHGDIEAARLQYNIKYEALYTFMLQARYRAVGRNQVVDQTAAIVQSLDRLFAALMARQSVDHLERLQPILQDITDAVLHERRYTGHHTEGCEFARELDDLIEALWDAKAVPEATGARARATPKQSLQLRLLLQKLTPGRSTVQAAIKLMLCTALGYSVHYFDDISHWYWVPMTVAIVMKPELGSIFVRAVQRMLGTAVGVVVGGLLLAYVPVGPVFILLIGAITFTLPWLAQRSYALTSFAVTPLVLVLIDFLAPERQGIDYAMLRLIDTLAGCAIVLVFGYLLWPRRHFSELDQALTDARKAIAQYLSQALANRSQPEVAQLSDARRAAYSKLVDMRAALQRSLAEPPPAGYEAAAWFPLVACAARLCDAITVYSASASHNPDPQEAAWLEQMPDAIEGLKDLPALPDDVLDRDTPEARLIASIYKETGVREQLYERVGQMPEKQLAPA